MMVSSFILVVALVANVAVDAGPKKKGNHRM